MERKIFKTTVGGREMSVEVGAYCGQANGSCIVRCGDTVVMVNATMAKEPREGMDYFPLSVDYEEKMYAVGKIPGGFKKREGRASDKAILTARLIDRPIRPLFPKGMYNDVSVVATVLSVDTNIPPEVFGMIGSSIALSISDIPFAGPTGSVVVGLVDGEYVINPDSAQRAKSKLHLSLSGTRDAIMMVEAGAEVVTEKEMLGAILFGHEEIKKIVSFIDGIVAEVGKPKVNIELETIPEDINAAVRAYADKKMDYVLESFDRTERDMREDELNADVLAHFADEFNDVAKKTKFILDSLYYLKKEKVRAKILDGGVRPDGRGLTDIRPIWCEVGMLPRAHGSAVFTRGQTQAMTVATLGTISEVQKLEGLDDEYYKRYMHQYNMPGYSTGEAKPLRSPGRREIGHGALAERALEPVLPSEEEFPYAIRTVSEILSSNGSTSQASVCGSTLALMDAGVPIKAPVAGIAMGLIKDADHHRVAVLSDIQGLEDFLGDMDFKVAGTSEGITAIQMDIKIKGIDEEILTKALEQARLGRLFILDKMLNVLPAPRAELSKWAPKIVSFSIDPDKIRDVIGSGGKTINKIIDETGVKIDINDEGQIFIASNDMDAIAKARTIVENIVRDVEVGDVYEGKVVKIMENDKGQFGASVNFAPGKDGMIHISKLSKERVDKVTDVVNVGDIVLVKVIKIDEKHRVDLRLKEILKKA
ncbi:MAG TPA: polyribonucleotide nucleotidyltransferase [Candidatus Limadaptatus stercorigallinarum]|uniref:Polyribonucleotide nucleotidyltransferase n=1 Tax=Candidatus Limadaptatus stercorigallinarum TaxID=2840845 RepID=A0A9D1HUI2_9FIRM|nr:polyribonucleotide nucleotidyltransferase [Christensenellales bacterium]HIU21580.1 polyribonucleotide nucleotidyltransferase [Candidatus Limadaptatus stercorigallinarum]